MSPTSGNAMVENTGEFVFTDSTCYNLAAQTIFMMGSTSMVQNGSEWLIFPITLHNKICTGSFANDEAEPWTLDYNFSAIVTC